MRHFATLAAVALLWGCDAAPAPDATAPPSPEPVAEESAAAPDMLPTPFTAEQIRDEWTEGLTLVMRRRTPDGESFERWTVVGADAEGAEIEFLAVDAEGNATGEPNVQRSAWTELRDHASYPANLASREQVTRDTALGELEGWLYTVRDEPSGTETEVFFATSLPGAPQVMRIMKDGAEMMEMAQIKREKTPR